METSLKLAALRLALVWRKVVRGEEKEPPLGRIYRTRLLWRSR